MLQSADDGKSKLWSVQATVEAEKICKNAVTLTCDFFVEASTEEEAASLVRKGQWLSHEILDEKELYRTVHCSGYELKPDSVVIESQPVRMPE